MPRTTWTAIGALRPLAKVGQRGFGTLDDRPRDRETEPGALPDGLAREERLEDAVQRRRLDPDARVRDLQQDVLTRLGLGAHRRVLLVDHNTIYDTGATAVVVKDGDLERLVDAVRAAQTPYPTAQVQLPNAAAAPAEARRVLRAACRTWSEEAVIEVGELVVSELVTNAVVHGNSTATLRVQLTPEALRIEVRDHSASSPYPQQQRQLEAEHGRGLLLVSALSAAWGVDPLPDGKSVWALIRREE